MVTSSSLAQSVLFDATNSTQPTMSTTGPAGTYDMTKTRRTIDSTGAETDTTETFSKSQTYTSGDGELSARSHIRTTGPTTTTVPSAGSSTRHLEGEHEMTKFWLAGVTAFALMTSAALAQSTSSDTTTSTMFTVAPIVGTYSSSKSQKTIDGNGTETDKSQTYTSGSGGTDAQFEHANHGAGRLRAEFVS